MSEVPISRRERIRSMAQDLFAELLGTPPQEVVPHVTFLELGADSLSLLRASQMIRDRFGVRIPFRRLLDDLDTVDALAAHLDAEMPSEVAAAPPVEAPSPTPAAEAPPTAGPFRVDEPLAAAGRRGREAAPGDLKWIVSEQLRLMAQQLELLRRNRGGTAAPASVAASGGERTGIAPPAPEAAPGPPATAPPPERRQVFVPYAPLERGPDGGLTPRQRRHLEELTRRITERTRGSKELTQTYRAVLANNRASAGFRQQWKELVYPLVGHRGSGARIWDVDGNEYIDLTMGFGALLFGHSPPFLERALREQLDLGLQIGPESDTAGRVAELVCELTGAERVTFCNSGTEAVMTALRLARTVHSRPKIAIFAGSFHGTFDGVLAKGLRRPSGELASIPLAPGVPQHMIDQVIMLDFDSFDSLDVVEAHAGELAAVLVEPRQSRRPDLEVRELLRRLREVTERHRIALVFDEVVTGFRLHPGGIQALYDVRADITTYGKAVANGMPIGIVAGKAAYLDALDGGMWRYGDDSWPEADTTFFAGTFFRHPLVMAGALAVLTHIKEQGPGLQEELGRRTTEFAATLDALFDERKLPIRMSHYGSLFLFTYPPDLRYMDLFFYLLLEKGIYIWERRVCYLSPAHTDEDLQEVVVAVRESLHEMQASGFLPSSGVAETAGAARILPLTEAQKELWALAQIGDEASVAYNLSAALKLTGPLEEGALESAFQAVVDRHEALRVTIDPLGESQRIAPRLELTIRRSELAPAEDRDEELSRLRRREARLPFDLVRGPLARVHLVKLGEERHVLLVTVHHIVVDGQSLGLILDEMARFYGAACRGERLSLPDSKQLTDYVEYLARLERDGSLEEMETFWLNGFADPPPALELPLDRPRPPLQTFVGQPHVTKLDPTLTAAVKQLARDQGCTLFMVLLTGVEVLLHRLSGQDDLVVGIPAAGQPLVGGALVGYCVNVLPVRTGLAGRPSFRDSLLQVRGRLLDAYEHQGYPLSRLMRKLGLRADPSRQALFSAMFNLDRKSGLEIPGLELELLPNPTHTAQFDAVWNATDSGDVLEVELSYNTDLFDAATIERWQVYLRNLLAAAAADPGGRIGEIQLQDAAELDQLLGAWNETAADFPLNRTFSELFSGQAGRTPKATAAVFEGRELSYEELDRQSGELARFLVQNGVGLESVVALLAERNLDFLIAILGIFKAGGAYLPLDPLQPVARHRQLLEDSGACCLLVSAEHLTAAREIRADLTGERPRLLELTKALRRKKRAPKSLRLPRPSPDNLAYVIYTSGSTGAPKGAMLHHQGMLHHLYAKILELELGPRDVIAHTSPQFFDISVWQFLVLLLVGGRVAIFENELVYSPPQLMERMADEGVSVFEVVPSLLRSIFETYAGAGGRRPGFERLRWPLLTGEALPPELCRQWLAYYPHIPIVNVYGPTECSGASTHFVVRKPPAPESARTPIGHALANMRLYVESRILVPQPFGVPGELCLAGAGVGRGYLGRAARTAEVFVPDPAAPRAGGRLYKTGDLVRWLPGGDLEFLHRFDHQVKIRGNRIELGEIEAALDRHPAVREAVVASRRDSGEAQIVAYLVPDGPAPESAALRADLGRELPRYMVPAFFVFLESMPLTPNGKLDRRALPAPEARTAEIEKSFTPPVTPAEQVLARLWSTVLGLERVGVHDNFFELGGDSIAGIQIVARARQEGVRLSPMLIFQHQTIAELASVAEASSGSGDEQGPVTGSFPLTPIQRWFFEQPFVDPHHWNMAALYQVDQPLSPPALERAVRHLLNHHDALRLRFSPGELEARHADGDGEDGPALRIDLAALPAGRRRAALESAAARLQGSLDPVQGPLLRVAFFHHGTHEPGRLFVTVHHLVVDVLSMRILAEDLMTACRQAAAGKALRLPGKTTSVKRWAERLLEHARSETLRDQAVHWLADRDGSGPRLPVDGPRGTDTEGSVQVCSVALDSDETRELLHDVPKAYRTQTSEVLLAALALAFEKWTGEALLVDIESHGREQLFDDLDVSRTVGWFTTFYPVRLPVRRTSGLAGALKEVKRRLRGVPDGGIGYGLLRFLSPPSERVEALRRLPAGEVSFNYRGGVPVSRDSPLIPVSESPGPSQGPRNARHHLLEVDAEVSGGRLEFTLRYGARAHRRSTIEGLAQNVIESLQEIVCHCRSVRDGELMPEDFPRARVSEKDLDTLLGKLSAAGR